MSLLISWAQFDEFLFPTKAIFRYTTDTGAILKFDSESGTQF